jgi:hypothetical protein
MVQVVSLHRGKQKPKMNLGMSVSVWAFWVAEPALLLAVGIALYSRKLHVVFPVFSCYIAFQILNFAILFPILKLRPYSEFFYTYWALQGLSLAVGFKVIHEIFLDVFRPYHTLKDLGSVLFKWAALVMLLVAGVVAASSSSGDTDPLVSAVTTVERCVRVIQCGLILFLLVFSKYLGVSRKQHSFGIALGFGSFAGIELVMVALSSSGHVTPPMVSLVNSLAYDLTIGIWLGYALLKSPARDAPASLLMSQRWEQSLIDIQHPMPGDSLIPMFEGMVDRAFSRTQEERTPLPDHASEPVSATVSTILKVRNSLPTHHLSSKT